MTRSQNSLLDLNHVGSNLVRSRVGAILFDDLAILEHLPVHLGAHRAGDPPVVQQGPLVPDILMGLEPQTEGRVKVHAVLTQEVQDADLGYPHHVLLACVHGHEDHTDVVIVAVIEGATKK